MSAETSVVSVAAADDRMAMNWNMIMGSHWVSQGGMGRGRQIRIGTVYKSHSKLDNLWGEIRLMTPGEWVPICSSFVVAHDKRYLDWWLQDNIVHEWTIGGVEGEFKLCRLIGGHGNKRNLLKEFVAEFEMSRRVYKSLVVSGFRGCSLPHLHIVHSSIQ